MRIGDETDKSIYVHAVRGLIMLRGACEPKDSNSMFGDQLHTGLPQDPSRGVELAKQATSIVRRCRLRNACNETGEKHSLQDDEPSQPRLYPVGALPSRGGSDADAPYLGVMGTPGRAETG